MTILEEVVYLGKNRPTFGYPMKNIVGEIVVEPSGFDFKAQTYIKLLNLRSTVLPTESFSLSWPAITECHIEKVNAHALMKYQLPVWAVVLTYTSPAQN